MSDCWIYFSFQECDTNHYCSVDDSLYNFLIVNFSFYEIQKNTSVILLSFFILIVNAIIRIS